jgi:hypothetical protein
VRASIGDGTRVEGGSTKGVLGGGEAKSLKDSSVRWAFCQGKRRRTMQQYMIAKAQTSSFRGS